MGEVSVHRSSPLAVQPTLLDRAIGYIAPEKAARRLRARAAMSLFSHLSGGGYVGGRSDRKSMQDWRPALGSAASDTYPGLETLRARSRDLSRNAPLATGALNTAVTSTVGSGLSAQPRVDRVALGLSDEEADQWENRARRIWRAWAETPRCDIEAELNFYGLQDLAFRAVLESGDVLSVERWRERAGELFGTHIQLIEADRVSNPNHDFDRDGFAQGVEYDDDGRTVRYWVQDAHPGDRLWTQTRHRWIPVSVYSATGERVARLLYHKRRPGQRRGVPYLAPVIEPLKQLERYSEAELMAAVIGSLFTVFVKSEGSPESPGGITGIEGAEESPPGELKLGPGLIADLNPGEDIEIANPNRPNQAFDPFVMAVLRQVGVALELPFEILIKHFSSSYSASRGAILEAWKFFRKRREWLAENFCDPAYSAVIAEAVARGWLEAPGFFEDPFVRAAWLRANWSGDSMPQIDPLKEVKAAELRVQGGFSTRDREAMEMTATDFETNHRQRAKEERMRREDGLAAIPAEALADEPAEPEGAAA